MILPLHKTMERRFLRVYRDALKHPDMMNQWSSRLDWYGEQNAWLGQLAVTLDMDVNRLAAAVAVVSPRISWAKLTAVFPTFARWVIRGGMNTFPPQMPGIKANWIKALAILSGQPIEMHLRGPKVTAFYRNLMCGEERATIDRHMIRVALGHRPIEQRASRPVWPGLPENKRHYEQAEAALMRAAELEGIGAPKMQAIIWVHWRNLHKVGDY